MLRRMHLPFIAFAVFTAFPSFAAITGTVMTSEGLPVAGATIALLKPETPDARLNRLLSKTPLRAAIVTAESDSKGNFSIDPGKEPVVDLRVEARGYAPEALRLAADDEAGAIALEAATVRKGTVMSGGRPVAGAVVVWSGQGAETITTTAVDGSYSVPDPDAWGARPLVIHPDYAIGEDETPLGPAKRKLNLTLSAGATVSGKALTTNGQTGVATATVSIDEWPLAVTGPDGSFTVKHAPTAWHTLTAAGGGLAAVHAHAGDGAVALKMTKPASLSGVVRDSKTQKPISGAAVRLGQSRQSAGVTVFTDAQGNYTFATAPPGTQPVQIFHPSYAAANSTVTLVAGQSLAKPLFAAPAARIVGVVQDEDKRPVAAARVGARSAGRNGMFQGVMGGLAAMRFIQQAHYSGPDGRFVLRGVQADVDLQVDALKAGFPSANSSTLKLAAGERKSGVTITIPRGVALTGRVTDHDGKPVSGAAVTTSEAEANGGGRAGVRRMVINGLRQRGDEAVKSASDGTFTVHLKPGLYDLSLKREGFAAKNVRGIQVNAASKPIVVKLDPGVELSGRITRTGVGVAGVNVNIVGEGGLSGTVTAADGSFSIGDLTAGQVMLNIRKEDEFIQQIRSTSVPSKDLVIDLPAGGRITGHVVDKSSRQPITAFDAGISTTRGGGGMAFAMPPSLKSFTSDDGSFVLENVPPGTTQLVANAPGYVQGKIGSLTVEDGKTVADVEIALEAGVKLTGHVTGPDGSPIAGASVRQDASSGGRGAAFNPGGVGATDSNGDYSIDDLESGEKSFTFGKAGYLSAEKTITLSGRTATLDAQLSAGLTATGMVVTDAGVPVPDAAVRATSGAEGMGGHGASTDANGAFHIDGLAPGHYAFRASKQGFGNGQVSDFDISAGAPVRVVMATGGVIFGHVTGLTADQSGAATVSASSSTGNASAPVDSSGSYRMEGAPTGTVRVSAAINGRLFTDSKSTPSQSVQVDSGGSIQVDLDFSNDIVISGHVTRQGQPVPGSIVAFSPRAGRMDARVQTTTDSNGAYSASGVTVGAYAVSVVDLQRLAPYTTTYDVKSSATFDIDIRTASVRGRVVDSSTGEGIPDVNVEVRGTDGAGAGGTRAATSDPSGGFVIDSVASGSYQISATKDSYAKDVENLTVGDTSPDDVTLKLASSSGVTLTVVDARDGSQLSATAHVVDSQGRDVSGDVSRFGGSTGALRLPLAAGTYQVTVFSTGYAPQQFTIASPSSQRVALTPGGTLRIHSQSGQTLRGLLIANGAIYFLSPFNAGQGFRLDPKPGTTTLSHIAPGSYTIQVLNGAAVMNSVSVTVSEGGIIDVNV
jgi:protocatechuate 3,4-dioxygenase beta subunit